MDVNRTLSIEIAIDEVTVEGFGPYDGFALKLALQRELTRLVRERGVPPAWSREGSRPILDVPAIPWDGHGAETGLAAALATELYARLER